MTGAATTDQKQFRSFVVDDESVISSTLAIILRRSGFDATSYTDPFEVLKVAEAQPPDLLISDVVMPGLSGIDLAIRLREEHLDCKALLFSGQAATANLLDVARSKGYDFDVLTKPIHPTEFLQKIQTVTVGA
jgi:DNA-binding response OmpR family regulator